MVGGDRLLLDPDTQWQITVGQWILDHRAVPETDVYSFTMRGESWISTQWLAQIAYAEIYGLFGWSGPVVLAAGASAATFALLTRFLCRHLSESATVVFVTVAVALTAPHILARPHVLALPVMVAWVGGLIAAADRRGAPSFRLLPLMVLWANLHGGFVFGLMMIAPIALDAAVNAEAPLRRSLVLAMGGVRRGRTDCGLLHALWLELAAGVAEDPRAWQRAAADHRMAAGGFGTLRPFEICLLGGIGLALFRGIKLPPLRIVILLGLLHMALVQGRAAEILALLAPLVLAAPLARQIGGADVAGSHAAMPARGVLFAGVAVALVTGTLAFASVHRFAPNTATLAGRGGG